MESNRLRSAGGVLAALAASAVLGGAVLFAQLRDLNHISRLRTPACGLNPAFHFLDTDQTERHEAILERRGGDPWQYRILAPRAIEAARRAIPGIELRAVFIALRLILNVLIFLAAGGLYAALGLGPAMICAGWSAIAWALCYAGYNAGMAFDSSLDLLFYLLAARVVVANRPGWLVPIGAVAALNRETSLLIPFLLAGAAGPVTRRRVGIGAAALTAQIAVLALVRIAAGPQEMIIPEGRAPGLSLLIYNAGRLVTWANLGITFGIVPLWSVLRARDWPRVLRRWAAAILPVWLAVHAVLAIAAETRLFLVPYLLVLLPGALFALQAKGGRT